MPTVCIDGKDVRGASKQTADGPRMLVAGVKQGSGLVLGQLEIASKTNEIPGLRELAGELDLAGRTVTADALPARQLPGRLPDHGHQGQPVDDAGRPARHGLQRLPRVRNP